MYLALEWITLLVLMYNIYIYIISKRPNDHLELRKCLCIFKRIQLDINMDIKLNERGEICLIDKFYFRARLAKIENVRVNSLP